MLTNLKVRTAVLLMIVTVMAVSVSAQGITRHWDGDDDNINGYYDDRVRIDRYLDVELWTNHSDGDFYVGDRVVIYFRVNRDAFVTIYSVDTRGRVNLLFPYDPAMDNFVNGGVTYTLPGPDDDFDLVISGPDGVENIQAIASRERFEIPDWLPESGLVCDMNDRHDFMDYINGNYFVRYEGQRFAFDRTALYVNDWEPSYFRPIYRPVYPSWTVTGNIYVDYPFGSTIYIDGVYWGVTPLYMPRLYVGWHTITVYNRWGYCWESDFHATRHHTVVFDRHIIVPRASVRSKYKEVRFSGYQDPVSHGYPKFKDHKRMITTSTKVRTKISSGAKRTTTGDSYVTGNKKYIRGTAKLTKSSRGYESAGITTSPAAGRIGTQKKMTSSSRQRPSSNAPEVTSRKRTTGSYTPSVTSSRRNESKKTFTTGKKSNTKPSVDQTRTKTSSGSDNGSGYYKKRSGSTSGSTSKGSEQKYRKKSGSSKVEKSSPTTRTKSESPKVKKNDTRTKSGSSTSTTPKKSSSSDNKSSKKSGGKRR